MGKQPLFDIFLKSATKPDSVGVAVRCGSGRGRFQPQPFLLLDFRPCENLLNATTFPLLFTCPKFAHISFLGFVMGVSSTSARNSPQKPTRWLTGGHISFSSVCRLSSSFTFFLRPGNSFPSNRSKQHSV